MAKKKQVLIPQYMRKFHCIGPACEDTCCIGWNVQIDEDTYKKYRKTNYHELKEDLNSKVTRNRSNPSEFNYAKIKLDKDMRCPFLTAAKLCKIQGELGEDYLSVTCSIYPRSFSLINGVLEKSASLSCPEVARIALLNPDIMEFDLIEEESDKKIFIGSILDTQQPSISNRSLRYFWELRIFTIQLLQNREYRLWERLIILGLFYQKLDVYFRENRGQEVLELIASFNIAIQQGDYKDLLQQIPKQSAVQMELLREVSNIRLEKEIQSQRYLDCLNEFLLGIKYDQDLTVEETAERYEEAYETYYKPLMVEHEYILENYLVNYVFKNLVPISEEKEVFNSYGMMILHYALIKMHLIGIAGFHKENFSIDHVLKLIQSFAKLIEHDKPFKKHVFEILKASKVTTMAYMAILIKN